MSEPVRLIPRPAPEAEIQRAVVDLLREALADAEAGKVLGVIIVAKQNDGDWHHRASATLSLREEIGALHLLMYDRMCTDDEEVE